MFSWLFGSTTPPVKEKKEEKTYTPEHLRQRAKQLNEIDHSWRAKLGCFECLGMENARKHAGFNNEREIIEIKRQLAEDKRTQKAEKAKLLQDEKYLSKRFSKRLEVDDSWTAFFCGTAYARKHKGFDFDENIALDDYAKRKFGFFASIFGGNTTNKPKETKPLGKSERVMAIENKQVERRLSRTQR